MASFRLLVDTRQQSQKVWLPTTAFHWNLWLKTRLFCGRNSDLPQKYKVFPTQWPSRLNGWPWFHDFRSQIPFECQCYCMLTACRIHYVVIMTIPACMTLFKLFCLCSPWLKLLQPKITQRWSSKPWFFYIQYIQKNINNWFIYAP